MSILKKIVFCFVLTWCFVNFGQEIYASKEEKIQIDPANDLQLSPYPRHTLIGSDVWLRPVFFPQDVKGYIDFYENPEKMKFYGQSKVRSAETVREETSSKAFQNREFDVLKIESFLDNKERKNFFVWSAFTTNGLSGTLYLRLSEDEDRFETGGGTFNENKGATRASQLVLEYVKEPFLATAHPQNVASQNVLLKLGFVPDLKRQGVSKFNSVRNYYLLDRPDEKNKQGDDLRRLDLNRAALTLFALCRLGVLNKLMIEQAFGK